MEEDSLAPVKPGDDSSPVDSLALTERPQARTAQTGHPQIPGPQKLCEIINVCCFKLLTFGVTCSTVVDNNTARHSGHLHGVIVAGEVNVILDEHSEVFSTVQERRPERETRHRGISGPAGPEASGLLLGSLQ